MKKPHAIIVLAGILLVVAGCTANLPYRRDLVVHPYDTTNAICLPPINPTNAFVIETNANFKIGYVELDDQGWFWAHQQWEDVKEQIGIEETNSRPQGLTIVVFIHGWKNNAAYDDGNVQTFRQVLTGLSSNMYPRRVFGVFVGWRGLSTESDLLPPLGMEASFYARKDAAERIGHEGAATQVFTELEVMQDEFNAFNESNSIPRTGLVIVGHSFGGDLLFSSISQVLTERLVEAQHHQSLKSFGDLVVLVNPAFEASKYNNLIALATSPEIDYPTNQRPALAIFTSRGDTATGFWFPFGRSLSTLFEDKRPSEGKYETNMFNIAKSEPPDQQAAVLETPGHDNDFITYDLDYTNYGTNLPPVYLASHREKLVSNLRSQDDVLAFNNSFHVNNARQLKPYIFTNSIGDTNYACILKARDTYVFKRGNPFFIVSVDTHIIRDHDDISNPVFLKFLQQFILFTETNYLKESEAYLRTNSLER